MNLTDRKNNSQKVIAFISDLHIQSDESKKIDLLERFFKQYQSQLKAFYCLGDLFETWIGDEQIKFFPKLITLLRKVSQSVPCYLIVGNRDFLLGAEFFETTGIKKLNDVHLLREFKQNYHLSHGDLLCTLDYQYQKWRVLSRSKTWQNNFLAQSFTKRIKQAQELRDLSKKQNQEKSECERQGIGEKIMDVNPAEIKITLNKYRCSIIHGHTHRQNVHHFSSYDKNKQKLSRIVLGDWSETKGNAWLIAENELNNQFISITAS